MPDGRSVERPEPIRLSHTPVEGPTSISLSIANYLTWLTSKKTSKKMAAPRSRGGHSVVLLEPLPGLVPVSRRDTSPLADVPGRRNEMSGRRHITPTPPAPIAGLCLTSTDSGGCNSEHAGDAYTCCDPVQLLHRELLVSGLPCRITDDGSPFGDNTAGRSRLPNRFIVPPLAPVIHCAAFSASASWAAVANPELLLRQVRCDIPYCRKRFRQVGGALAKTGGVLRYAKARNR
jgi:hypothetical protein